MFTDPISDMLTRIKNAYMARKGELTLPSSKLKKVIANLLKEQGYIGNVSESGEKKKELNIKLLYKNKKPALENVQRVSKPSRRVYVKADKMPKVLNGYGVAIISTSKGVMTNKEARKQKIGGEIICKIY